jgi:serine/threonine protein kinase
LLVELRSGPLIRLILEYCENGDLFERIRHRASSESDARKWFCQVLSAVDFVHRHGFSHGDISPENVLLDANDDAKLADFGFARRHPSKGALLPPARAGKPYSLAPEVFARLPFDGRRADIYSLGTLLYMMLTGRFPYNKPDAFDTSFSLIYDGNLAKALEVARLKVPPLAADLIQRLMSPPESRPSIEDIYRHPWISAVPRSLKAQLRGA